MRRLSRLWLLLLTGACAQPPADRPPNGIDAVTIAACDKRGGV
jgi:hypothetical protein